ncbi:MAG: TIGR04282 family arsenosugar biosynthesis glycosyltransferase [Rhodomicrobium sp.]
MGNGAGDTFCGIAVMAKASQPGRTKTRLCPPLTFDEAAALNTAFLKDIAENLVALSAEADIGGSMAFAPRGSEGFFEAHLPASIGLYEVSNANFGICLIEALKLQFAAGHVAACVLNSDSPTLPLSILLEMVEALAKPGDRAVIGPSSDGGYYLLACKALHTPLFEDIAWSTPQVFTQTLERAAAMCLPVYVLPEWYDVDDCGSLNVLLAELLESRSFSPCLRPSLARNSAALLQSLISNANLRERIAAFMSEAPPLREDALS